MNDNPNSTCLVGLKQIGEELKIRTKIECGLELVTTDKECHDWSAHNTQFYSLNGSLARLEKCQNYFEIFNTAAQKPVSSLKMI